MKFYQLKVFRFTHCVTIGGFVAIVVQQQNAMRRRQSRDVASNSYHIKGQGLILKSLVYL